MMPDVGHGGSSEMPADLDELGAITRDRFRIYEELLAKWNPKINLVAASTIPHVRARHFSDSAQLLRLAPKDVKSWVDLGSGAGFPGLVVAIMAAELRPELGVTLIEADQRKATFLRTVSRETGLAPTIVAERAECVAGVDAEVVSARALAPLPRLCELAVRHLRSKGVCLFMKGAQAAEELEQARRAWQFSVETHQSQTDASGVIFRIEGLHRA